MILETFLCPKNDILTRSLKIVFCVLVLNIFNDLLKKRQGAEKRVIMKKI